MDDRGRIPREERQQLVAAGMLALALALGAAGAGVMGAAPTPDQTRTMGALAPPAMAPGADGSQLAAVGDRLSIRSWEAMAGLEANGDERREYLARMSAMMRRRRVPPATLDPYQASLHPAVYPAGETSPSATFTSS